jgi:hypothetical protein
MSIRSRELSQFGSFIYIDDTTKNIAITTDSQSRIGIGTIPISSNLPTPNNKVFVEGDIWIGGNLNVSGSLTFPIEKIDLSGEDNEFNINTSGIITAGEFRTRTGGILTAFDSWNPIPQTSNIYRPQGNVGILKDNPQYPLDVAGVVAASQFISTVTGGGIPPIQVSSSVLCPGLNAEKLSGLNAPGAENTQLVGTIDTQILRNKLLDDASTFFVDNVVDTKRLQFQLSGITAGQTRILTPPDADGTIILNSSVGAVTTNMIANSAITNDKVSSSIGSTITYNKLNLFNSIRNSDLVGGITNNKLVNSTISNIPLGSNLADLTLGTHLSYSPGTVGIAYTGGTARQIQTNATASDTPSTLVARDSSGRIDVRGLSVTSSGILTSFRADFGSLTFQGGIKLQGYFEDSYGSKGSPGQILGYFRNPSNNFDTVQWRTGTISGVSLGNSLFSLSFGTYLQASGSTYDGSVGVTIATNATPLPTVDTLVARNANGGVGVSTLSVSSTTNSTSTTTGALVVAGGVGIGSNMNVAGFTTITSQRISTSTSTGALVVAGGVGIGSSVYVGGNLYVTGNIVAGGGGAYQLFHMQDRKIQSATQNDEGGDFLADAWRQRVLNTSVTSTIVGASLSTTTNFFTLPAGTYQITAYAPAYGVGSHRARLSSGSNVLIYGTNENNLILGGGTKQSAMTYSKINGIFTLASTTTDLQIQHRCEADRDTDGFGVATNFGINGVDYETYTDVLITKLQ